MKLRLERTYTMAVTAAGWLLVFAVIAAAIIVVGFVASQQR